MGGRGLLLHFSGNHIVILWITKVCLEIPAMRAEKREWETEQFSSTWFLYLKFLLQTLEYFQHTFQWLIALCAQILLLQCICRFGCLTWLNFNSKMNRFFFDWDTIPRIVITIMCTRSYPAQPLKTKANVKLCKVCQVCFYFTLVILMVILGMSNSTDQVKQLLN